VRERGGVWSPLGTGPNGSVNALAIMPNGDIIAGGVFTTAGGVNANHIAPWNGLSWSSLDFRTDSIIYSLAVLPNVPRSLANQTFTRLHRDGFGNLAPVRH